MKQQVAIAWTCLAITFLCSLRACQLYWSSTTEFRSVEGFPWPFRHNNNNDNFTYLEPRPYHPASIELSAQEPMTTNNNKSRRSHILGDQPDGFFYFTQISDLHISKYRAKGHTVHFLQFIQSVLPVIRPEFVVVTGDLTDAKDYRRITSQQYLEEWKTYKLAIDQQPWTNTTWYDMRGNHDCFDLPSWQSKMNLYRTFGQSADRVEHGQGVYTWQYSPSFGEYQFVAIDACPKRGPSRPFNFFGYLTSSTMDRLASALLKPSNHTFVFSHYPTTTMVFGVSSQGHTFRDLAKHYSIYFCGHLHRLIAGLGDVLQSYDPATKTLELELGDMKDHGMYRIVAVDNDVVSFVDARLPSAPLTASAVVPLSLDSLGNEKVEWPRETLTIHPVILITNPKDARFAMDTKEPLHRIQSSTHIRFLVFTDQSPDQLSFQITMDGKPVLFDTNDDGDDNHTTAMTSPTYVGNDTLPLWTLPWNPLAYRDGAHVLMIQARTTEGQVGESSVIFRTDGRRANIGGGPGEWIISTHMSTVLQCVTLFSIVTMLTLLLVPRFYFDHDATSRRLLIRIHLIDQQKQQQKKTTAVLLLQRRILVGALRCLQFPSTQPSVWYATFGFLLALLTLPWFRAEFIPSGATPAERMGTFYLYGMVFADEWLPLADTYLFAVEQVVLNVVVFFILFLVRSISSEVLVCKQQQQQQQQRSVSDSPVFRGIEIIYWLWRMSELVALASFYGGVWPTLVQNILVLWLLFVGMTLGTYLCNGSGHATYWMTNGGLEGCEGCAKGSVRTSSMMMMVKDQQQEEEEHVVMEVDYRLSASSSSGSSASSTPFNRSPRAKNRKRSRWQ